MESALVSVVIPNYNQESLIEKALYSVLDQTYKNIELLVLDDCSTDKSKDVLEKIRRENPSRNINIVYNPVNLGITKNKNLGFKLAKGDYITYLDGDDFYYPEKIEKELERLITGDFEIVYSRFNYVNTENEVWKEWKNEKSFYPEGNIFENVFKRDFPNNTLFRCELVKKEIWQKIGFLDESRKAYEDWDCRIKMSKIAKIGYVDYVGCAYVDNPNSINSKEKKFFFIEEFHSVIQNNKHLLDDLEPNISQLILKKLNENILVRINKFEPNFLKRIYYKLKFKI